MPALLFVLPLGAWWAGRRMARSDWVWAVLLAVATGVAYGVTVGEPLVSAVLGIVVLQEQIRAGGAEWVLIVLAAVLMVVATAALARASARGSPETGRPAAVSPGSR